MHELIANADDASYARLAPGSASSTSSSPRVPTVVVRASLDAVCFASNEDGLRPEDVTAMSDLGASTKVSRAKRAFISSPPSP